MKKNSKTSSFKQEPKPARLSLLPVPETLVLEALDGRRTFVKAKKIFKSYFDSDFENWGLDNRGKPTPRTIVQVYWTPQNVNYAQMFNSLPSGLDSLCLTQHQSVRFCEKYSRHLKKEGLAIYLLFKENREYFIGDLRVRSDGLDIGVNHFEDIGVWDAGHPRCMVVPQLKNYPLRF